MLHIRIHHFFDILRDYGSKKELKPHIYGHSYHVIGKRIYSNEVSEMTLIIENDDICRSCTKLSEGHCIDVISHRADFTSKEKFNNFLDARIMKAMNLKKNQIISFKDLLSISQLYINSIESIYRGNNPEHTKTRKRNVETGIEMKQRELHINPGKA